MLAAILMFFMGQCSPGTSYPSVGGSITSRAHSTISAEKLWVRHEGMDFVVEGTRLPSGNIRWQQDHPFNARALVAARGLASTTSTQTTPTKSSASKAVPNYGLDPTRMAKVANGPEATRYIQQAKSIVGPEEDKLHLTLIGSPSDRDSLTVDLDNSLELKPLKDSLLVQCYEPGDWAINPELGFPHHGVLLQDKTGKVLYRSADYKDFAKVRGEIAAVAAGALRKPPPNYDPSKDPGPATGKGGACPLGFTRELTILLFAALACIFLLPGKVQS